FGARWFYTSTARPVTTLACVSGAAGGLMFPLSMHIRYFLWKMSRSWPFGRGGRPTDPFVGVREPNRRKPGGRSSAIALTVPPAHQRGVDAVGGRGRRERFARSNG